MIKVEETLYDKAVNTEETFWFNDRQKFAEVFFNVGFDDFNEPIQYKNSKTYWVDEIDNRVLNIMHDNKFYWINYIDAKHIFDFIANNLDETDIIVAGYIIGTFIPNKQSEREGEIHPSVTRKYQIWIKGR